jgi:hypothetical protein
VAKKMQNLNLGLYRAAKKPFQNRNDFVSTSKKHQASDREFSSIQSSGLDAENTAVWEHSVKLVHCSNLILG